MCGLSLSLVDHCHCSIRNVVLTIVFWRNVGVANNALGLAWAFYGVFDAKANGACIFDKIMGSHMSITFV